MVCFIFSVRKNKYDKILSVTTHLISQKGFQGTSLQKIADKVGLHKSSLFHYIKNKEELLFRILEKSMDEANINLEKITTHRELGPEEKLKKAFDSHLTLLGEYIYNVNIYLNEFRSLSKKNKTVYLEKRKKYERDFEKIIVEMKTKGYFNGLDTKIVTFGILGMLNWVVKWYKKVGPLTTGEISNIFYKMIMGR